MDNRTEQKFRYGIWKMPEWNGMEDFKNGMEDNLPYFHTNSILYRFCALYLQKNTDRCRVVINNIVTKVFNYNIYAYYLSTNRGTLVVYIAQTVYVLHHCKYIEICTIDVIVDDFDWFYLFFCLFFEIDNLPCPKFCFLISSRKLLFIYITFIFLLFQRTIILFGAKAWYVFL